MHSTSSSPLNGRTSEPPSLPTVVSPPPSLPLATSTIDPAREVRRSKVFRHHLRLEGDPGGSLYSHTSPPILAIERRSQLPADYKATLPTLPHIARRQERPAAGPGSVGDRHQGDEVLEQQTGPKVTSRCRRLDH